MACMGRVSKCSEMRVNGIIISETTIYPSTISGRKVERSVLEPAGAVREVAK